VQEVPTRKVWKAHKRYKEFQEFHKIVDRCSYSPNFLQICQNYAPLNVDLPGKKIWNRFDDSFLRRRLIDLEKYMIALLQVKKVAESFELKIFLQPSLEHAADESAAKVVGKFITVGSVGKGID
jgi:hypothetical protein